MRTRTPFRVAAAAASFALLVTACGGEETPEGEEGPGGQQTGGQEDPTEQPEGQPGGTYSAALTEPSFLAPFSNCYESECTQVLGQVLDPVVSVDFETGELIYNGLAENIESNDDQTVWTVTIKPDRTFHNGEPVNSDAFLRAWAYSSNPENAQATAGFLARIDGSGEGNRLSGLRKIDDMTFEVTLDGPFSQFGQQMSYTPAFHPIAEECLNNIEQCNESPIGTGPYIIEGQWRHDQGITVTKWPDYSGEQPAQADTIEFQMYADPTAEYRAYQNGQLDVLTISDPNAYLEASANGDIDFTEPTASLTYLGMPTQQEPYDSVELRQAVSLSIDRQAIIDQVLNGLYFPSTDIVTPPIPGSREDACEFCMHDPEAAQRLAQGAGVPENFTMQLYFNADAGHELWTQAAAQQIQQTLGWDFELNSTEWAQYLELLDARDFEGPFRLGWSLDYPSPENYIRPLVGCEGDSNYSDYCNRELDELLEQGDRADTVEEAFNYYQQAGDIALRELPIIPLWSGAAPVAASDDVSNVRYDVGEGEIAFGEITVVQ